MMYKQYNLEAILIDENNNPISYDDFVAKIEQQHYDNIDINEYLSNQDVQNCLIELIYIYSHYTGEEFVKKLNEHLSKYMVDFDHCMINHKATDLLIKMTKYKE